MSSARCIRRIRTFCRCHVSSLKLALGAVLCVGTLIVSVSFGFDDKPTEVGLRGIIPAEVPYDLLDEEFAILGGNWKDWSEGTAQMVVKLYEEAAADLPAQQKLVNDLKSRVRVMELAMADPQYASIYEPLIALHGRLARRVELADAMLTTLKLKPEDVKGMRLKGAGAKISAALNALETDLNTVPSGAAWLPYVKANEITELMKNPADNAKALPVLTGVQGKIDGRSKLENKEQAEFLGKPAFLALAAAIGQYAADAAKPSKPNDEPALRTALAALEKEIEAYEEDGLSQHVAGFAGLLDGVAKAAADDGDLIKAVVAKHYRNNNFKLVASETFLSKMVHEEHNEQGEIVDQVGEANVRGTQTTKTTISIDTKPSGSDAMFLLTLSGRVQSNTAGYTSQATIYSTGDHQFWATRPVHFDGYRVKTEKPSIRVEPHVYPYSASTTYDGGLFAGTARSRAIEIANSRRYQSEEHSRMRVTERVLPRFETESEKGMKELDEKLQGGFPKRLKEANVYPESTTAATSETSLFLSSHLGGKDEPAGDPAPSAITVENGMVLSIHQSLMNNVFARMQFAGRTMTEDDVKKEIERFLSIVAGEKVSLDSADKKPAETKPGEAKPAEAKPAAPKPAEAQDEASAVRAIVFEKEQPIRFRFEKNQINLILRAGFKQEGKEDIPAQEVTVPFTYSVEGDNLVAKTGDVTVSPITQPESVSRQIAYAGIIKKKIERSIPARTRSRSLTVKQEGRPDHVVQIAGVKALGGWLMILGQ